MAFDSETLKYLDDAKKGKARRFVMICKGVKILSLIVYKKGTLEKYKKEAKAEGKGQFYHGVVEGSGLNIVFKLSTADGFDAPPVKTTILKEYVREESGIGFQPEFEIVPALPEISDADDDGGTTTGIPPQADTSPATETAPAESPTTETQATTEPPPVDAESANRFRQQMEATVQQLKAANNPELAAAAKPLLAEAAGQARQGAFTDAFQNLDRVARMLQQAPPLAAESAAETETASQWEARWSALEPACLNALSGNPPNADKIRVVMNYAVEQAASGNHAKALAALERLEPLLEETASAAPTVPAPSLVDLQQARLAWETTRKKVAEELQGLEKVIRQAVESHNLDEEAEFEYDLSELGEGCRKLYSALDTLDTRLIDKLDEALNAEGDTRGARNAEARDILREYRKFIASDQTLDQIDGNPFLQTKIKTEFDRTLNELSQKL